MKEKDNYYTEIKDLLINNEINRKVKQYSINKSDINTYYEVGKLLVDAGKHYGEGIIKKYSIKLTNELGTGYSVTNLKRIRQFYIIFEKSPALTDQLSWSHYCELLPIKDINEKILQSLILEDISSFMKELGEGFSFIDNEYKIRIGNTYNYIDLLLYNVIYKCYVVIELKTTEG